jgi:hypothetical protein
VLALVEVEKTLVFVVMVEVELVLTFSTVGAFAVIVSTDLVVLQLIAVLEKVAAGKILVLVVQVELVRKSLSAGASGGIVSMDSVLLSLPKQDLSVGMALQVVVTVGMFLMSGSPSLDSHRHLHLLHQHQHIPGSSLPLDLDPSTSSCQPFQPVAHFPLRGLYFCSLDSGSLPQRAWLLLLVSGRDRVRLSLPRIWLGRGDGDILCQSGGRRCSGWRI